MSEPHVLVASHPKVTDRAVAFGARGRAFECPHGATSAILLPGAKAVSDLTLLDLLLTRHHGQHGCRCTPDPRTTLAAPGRA